VTTAIVGVFADATVPIRDPAVAVLTVNEEATGESAPDAVSKVIPAGTVESATPLRVKLLKVIVSVASSSAPAVILNEVVAPD
jgi:hypothetical protein